MLIQSTKFGEIYVEEERIVFFPWGIPGFRNEHQFAIVPMTDDSPFSYLQSVENADLSFLLIEPFTVFKDYQFELDDEIAGEVGLSGENPPCIYNIVTVADKLENMTANLLAPLIINWASKEGFQLVLENVKYTTKHRVFPNDSGCEELGQSADESTTLTEGGR